MTIHIKVLSAAVLLSTGLAASPAMAQAGIHYPGECAQASADCPNAGAGSRYRYYRDGGFWPGEVAAGVVGGAVGAAGAIATAPFRASEAYAYYDEPYVRSDTAWNGGRQVRSYAARNGFVCQPGAHFRGQDGRRHLCQ